MFLYDKTNIDILKKKNDISKNKFLAYFLPMLEDGVKNFVSNIDCELKILEIDDNFIPIVFAQENYDDSLYVSIFSHYIKYTIQEFERFINNEFLKKNLIFILNFIGKYFIKNGINKVIYVNQALISTNLYPQFTKEQIKHIIDFFKEKYTDYAIVFKNINKFYDKNLYDNLCQNKCHFVISRQIFIIDQAIRINLKSKYLYKINNDLKLLKKSNYIISDVTINEDWAKISDLYTKLYIEKYSKYNPKYTEKYFKLIEKSKVFDLKLLKLNGKIYGMSVIQFNSSILTVPAIGYDMSKRGIYSMMNAHHIKIFADNYKIFNLSAGIADYKMQRGAKPVVEYMAIYYNHLKLKKCIMYNVLEIAVNIVIPILCRKKLCGFVPNKI